MTLAEAKEKSSLQGVPKLAESEFTLLWFGGFWDGPTSGMLRLRGRECAFEMISENENPEEKWYRRFAVVSLSDAQIAREMEVHEQFRRHVGTHCDYGEQQKEIRPQSEHHLFYDKHLTYCQSSPFEKSEVIAWFEQ
jgi:hypothetical protein